MEQDVIKRNEKKKSKKSWEMRGKSVVKKLDEIVEQ